MKLVSIFTACYNEEENVRPLYEKVKQIFNDLPQYDYEHVFIDNSSTDQTKTILREIAKNDKKVKVIFNTRNFGHIRSPNYGILQTKGDAVISLVADFQDPPEMINEFLEKWEQGYDIVIGIKKKSRENPLMFLVRKLYYVLLARYSEVEQVKNFTGFGLYDKKFIDVLRTLKDPYPYFRGLITELGFKRSEITYTQPKRKKGKTKNNFYSLYDMAMLGFVNHSKYPLRMASFFGFGMAMFSFLIAIGYLVYKIIYWERFSVGVAPLIIGLFFFVSVQLCFIGIIGEYIGSIYTQVKNRPLVIEEERINFD
ncbi:glycosyltransferase family 2 protein [bacterium]